MPLDYLYTSLHVPASLLHTRSNICLPSLLPPPSSPFPPVMFTCMWVVVWEPLFWPTLHACWMHRTTHWA